MEIRIKGKLIEFNNEVDGKIRPPRFEKTEGEISLPIEFLAVQLTFMEALSIYLLKKKEDDMELRERIADVLDTELPWLREDLLKLADKICALFPKVMSKPKSFPISACCNASVKETLTGKYICHACQEFCKLADWNNPEPKKEIEELENIIDTELMKVASPLKINSEEVTTLTKGLTKAIGEYIIRVFNNQK